MKIGLKARFQDIHIIDKLNPDLIEFHMSDKDLDNSYVNIHDNRELALHAPEYWNQKLLDLSSIRETNVINSREKSVEIFQKTINKAKEMSKMFKGTPRVIIHPGGYSMNKISSKEELEQRYNLLKKSFHELDKNGVEVLFENLPPFPWFFGGQWSCNQFLDAEEIKTFCTETKANVCIDISHLKLYCNHAKKDFFYQLELILPHSKHIHISDATGVDGEGIQIGEGEIDFERLIQTFKKHQNLVYVIEVWQGHNDQAKGFKIGTERFKKIWNKENA